jgi:hypothetical protein
MKEPKTAHELAQMIMERMPGSTVYLEVRPDPAYGWAPFVVSATPEAIKNQNVAEQIAAELRLQYELKSAVT